MLAIMLATVLANMLVVGRGADRRADHRGADCRADHRAFFLVLRLAHRRGVYSSATHPWQHPTGHRLTGHRYFTVYANFQRQRPTLHTYILTHVTHDTHDTHNTHTNGLTPVMAPPLLLARVVGGWAGSACTCCALQRTSICRANRGPYIPPKKARVDHYN